MVSYSRSQFNSDVENDLLKFSLPVSPYVNAHWKTALNIHCIYLHNVEIYYVFKTCWIISLLSTRSICLIILSFSVQISFHKWCTSISIPTPVYCTYRCPSWWYTFIVHKIHNLFYYNGNAGNFFSSFCKLSRSAIVTSVNVGHWYAVNYQKHHLMCKISVLFLVCDVAVTRI